MPLPILTFDAEVYRANRDTLLRYGRTHEALLAPHAKTAMIPALAAEFIAEGGWGVTVADVRQAAVMIDAGIEHILLANEVGGIHGARHLARLLCDHPQAKLTVFADSVEAVEALDRAWREAGMVRPLPVLLEFGLGRAGARDLDTASKVLESLRQAERHGRLRIGGVAAYEGAAAVADGRKTISRIDALLTLQAEGLRLVREAAGDDRRLIATAGGSLYFDRVVQTLGVAAKADGGTDLVLRPGAILYGDHGVYERGFAAMDARGGFCLDSLSASEAFRPVLRVWAEVLSCPEPGLAICGMGMRDVSFDSDLPRPLRVFRDGSNVKADTSSLKVERLNDQHAFVSVGHGQLRVGDVIEFGISHPCTCLHLWRTVQALDSTGQIVAELTTHFA